MSDEIAVDRDELRKAARDMLGEVYNAEAMRAYLEDHRVDELWPHIVEVGWTGIDIPESDGGAGAEFGDLAVVLTEGGRALMPTTLFASAVLASGALQLGTDEPRGRWLSALADGRIRGTAALADETGDIRHPGYTAEPDPHGWLISGTSALVPAADGADVLILRVATASGELLAALPADSPGLRTTPAPMVDQTRAFGDVVAENVRVTDRDVIAVGADADAVTQALLDRAAIALACDSLGVAQELLDRTVQYVRERQQFGRAIGSFQAVKHRCTDMFVATETSKFVVEEAVQLVSNSGVDMVATSRAKAHACDVAVDVAAAAVQLHGGVGVTWEYDIQLFAKRALLNQTLYGDTHTHLRRVAALTLPVPSGSA